MTIHPIFKSFLDKGYEAARAIADASDIFDIQRIGDDPRLYLAEFDAETYVRDRSSGDIALARGAAVGIRFPDNYLVQSTDPLELLTLVHPMTIMHPNASGPGICIGPVDPGTPLDDIAYRIYEVLTFDNYVTIEMEALSREACAWARRNPHLFPTDDRPLKWRRPDHPTPDSAAVGGEGQAT